MFMKVNEQFISELEAAWELALKLPHNIKELEENRRNLTCIDIQMTTSREIRTNRWNGGQTDGRTNTDLNADLSVNLCPNESHSLVIST